MKYLKEVTKSLCEENCVIYIIFLISYCLKHGTFVKWNAVAQITICFHNKLFLRRNIIYKSSHPSGKTTDTLDGWLLGFRAYCGMAHCTLMQGRVCIKCLGIQFRYRGKRRQTCVYILIFHIIKLKKSIPGLCNS
jgi:hypothetical protein